MGFGGNYLAQFEAIADKIRYKGTTEKKREILIGEHLECYLDANSIIEIMNIWVRGIDKLITLTDDLYGDKDKVAKLYEERGITYDDFFYFFSKEIKEENYIDTPAFIFSKTYSKDLLHRRFNKYEFTPESYKEYILSLAIEPTKYFNKKIDARLSAKALFAHTYCVAKTRSGKTEFLKLIIYNLIKGNYDKTSLLILDPHGEFARELRRLKIIQEHLDDFVYVDPTIHADYTPVFNPFEIKEKDTAKMAYSTDSILDAFQQLLRDQNITGNMRRLLRHCIYALLYNDGTTMMDLLTILLAIGRNRNQKVPEFFPEEERLMKMGRTAPDPLTQKFFEYGWKEVDSRTITAVTERIDGILSHPLVRRFVVGKSSFELEKYLNEGKIVLVNLDFTKLGNIGSEAIGRLMVSEAQSISAQRNRISKRLRPRTLIFVDECQRFISAAIERALSEFGKFNTFLFLSHQYIEQIDDGMVKAMLSNTENKVVGRNSAATMASISSDVGVSKEDLMEVNKYQFYIKAGDDDPFLFQSSDFLLDQPDSEHYITEDEANSMVDQIMIERYYRQVNGENGAMSPNTNAIEQNAHLNTSASQNLSIELDTSDF